MRNALATAATLLTMALLLAMFQTTALAVSEQTLRFAVTLDGRDIGEHRFEIRDDAVTAAGPERSVAIEADFLVRLLRIPVFRYTHQNHESWDGGCLQRLESQTTTNGTVQRVELDRRDDGYRLNTPEREQRVDAPCLLSFAYWDPAIIGAEQLVNSQNGALIDVAITALGRERPDWLGETVADAPVQAFRLQADDDGDGSPVDIRIYYTDAWEWVGLESPVTGGRLMRYQRLDIPATQP